MHIIPIIPKIEINSNLNFPKRKPELLLKKRSSGLKWKYYMDLKFSYTINTFFLSVTAKHSIINVSQE
jgi:hypothetical protein